MKKTEDIHGDIYVRAEILLEWYQLVYVAPEYHLRQKEKEYMIGVLVSFYKGNTTYLSEEFKSELKPFFKDHAISDYMTKVKKKNWVKVGEDREIQLPPWFSDLKLDTNSPIKLEVCLRQ